MEQRLAAENPVDWSPTPAVPPAAPEIHVKDKEVAISRLESQVEEQVSTNTISTLKNTFFRLHKIEVNVFLIYHQNLWLTGCCFYSQRLLRLQDAKQVEAKAAKIKEWVTNKLREVGFFAL